MYFIYDNEGYYQLTRALKEQPENSTTIEPDLKEGYWSRFTGRNWEYEKIPTCAEGIVGVSVPAAPASVGEEDTATPHQQLMRAIIANILSTTADAKVVVENGVLTVVAVSKEEQEAEKTAEAFETLRAERDKRIAVTDYLMTVDYPLSDESKAKAMAYRQALRDLPEQEGAPWMGTTIPWPELNLD